MFNILISFCLLLQTFCAKMWLNCGAIDTKYNKLTLIYRCESAKTKDLSCELELAFDLLTILLLYVILHMVIFIDKIQL